MEDKQPKTEATSLETLIEGLRGTTQRKFPYRIVVPVLIVAMFLWFIPWVPRLKSGSVTVKQWTKKKGLVHAKVGPDEADWISRSQISRHIGHAVVVAEDGRFYQHHGLDFREIKHSIEANRRRKKYVRGASTITQQVVKMAFLSREKTLIRKSREALGAVILEQIMAKEDILEWYLNLVEFGDGIYGIKAAAQHYFGTKPALLTIEQSIHLAVVIPSPNSWSAGLRKRELTPFGEKRFAKIALNMRRQGYLTQQQWLHAISVGNFGRPLAAYENYVAEANRDLCLKGDRTACQEETKDDALEVEDFDFDELLEDTVVAPEQVSTEVSTEVSTISSGQDSSSKSASKSASDQPGDDDQPDDDADTSP